MSSIIHDTIHHLLMEEEQVCLPGLGTLRLLAQPALISPLEGRAAPPSEQVSFNANLVLDDGRLLRALQENGLDETEATRQLGDFLRNMQENLDAGRSFTVDGLGRFFKHFDGRISFTSGGENYSKSSFGLPDIELRPIVRTEKQRSTAAADVLLGTPSPAPASAPGKNKAAAAVKKRLAWAKRFRANQTTDGQPTSLLYHPELRKILWYAVYGIGMLLVLFVLFKVIQLTLSQTTEAEPIARQEDNRIRIPADRVNVAPGPKPVDADRVAPDEPPRLNDPAQEARPYEQPADPPVRDRTGNTEINVPPPADATVDAPGEKTAFIATGMYGSQRNVEKNLDRIRAAGFETFTRPEGRLTRIGAKVEYLKQADLDAALERLQRSYSDAFILEE